jgi:hypothetical protein
MKNDQDSCTDKDGIEFRKRYMHLIHRCNHKDDDGDDNYDDNNNNDEHYDSNNSFVRSCAHIFTHSFKDLSTVL